MYITIIKKTFKKKRNTLKQKIVNEIIYQTFTGIIIIKVSEASPLSVKVTCITK